MAKLVLVEEERRASGPSLIVDRGARVATLEGRRVELPPREFDLLAALAERPGQPTSAKGLISRLWENEWGITEGHVRWHVWKLRDLLGDDNRDRPLIGNRRGHGYALELPLETVRVVNGLVSEEEGDSKSEIAGEIPSEAHEEGAEHLDLGEHRLDAEPEVPRQKQVRFRVPLLAATFVAILMLASGWLAVSWFSEQDVAGSTSRTTDEDAVGTLPEEDSVPQKRDEREQQANNRGGKASSRDGLALAQSPSAGDVRSTEVTVKGSRIERKNASAGKESDDSTSPRPTSQLYHLHNPETGDHFMTTSSSESNQKQAAGYTLTIEGRVFSDQVKGTVAIPLDTGTTYIYRDASSNTDDEASNTKLYRLDKEDDYFYTRSSSAANQAEAQGWARAVVGYVAT